MANLWVDYAMKRADSIIVGLVEINYEQAKQFADRKGLSCPIFLDIEEAITNTNANLVFDITIPASHYHIASTAMKNGCHVFSEKPLAESLEQCIELVQLSQTLGKTHAIMQNRRFDLRLRTVHNMINDKVIGDIGYIGADFFIGPHFGGFRDVMDHPLLLDMAIHTFDQARLISGANPISVYCQEHNPKGSWYKGNAMAICIFEMSDGSIFDYRGSWCAEGAPTSWEASWRVIGEYGTILWDGHDKPVAQVIDGELEGKFMNTYKNIEYDLPAQDYSFHEGCLADMFYNLADGTTPETVSSDNIYSMAMVLGAIQSAKQSEKIYIENLLSELHTRKV